jgi:hypothetical protein
MDHNHVAVCESPGAQQIQAYCRDLGQQLRVPVLYTRWAPDHMDAARPARYMLSIHVTGVVPVRQSAFSRGQVLRYPDGPETAAVEARIRHELTQCLADLS